MKISFRRTISVLLLFQLAAGIPVSTAQDQPERQTRPRRVHAEAEAETARAPITTKQDAPSVTIEVESEPTVRVALATAARAANVSVEGDNGLLYATHEATAPAPLPVARVRVAPRAYSVTPLLSSAEDTTDAIGDSGGRGSTSEEDNDTAVRSISARAELSRPAPSETARSNNSGARRDVSVRAGEVAANSSALKQNQSVRLTARASVTAPRFGAAVYAAGNNFSPASATPLLDARAPVTFSAARPEQFVRFNNTPYRGRVEVFANARGSLTVVNAVGLEDYVRGVVANELSPGAYPELEALKAQAVAARTYALKHLGQHAREGYDLLPDTRSQVYGGLATERALTDRAVAETRGRVLTHDGQVIDALYTSTCGGRTEHNENVFGGAPVAYLRGRECALERDDAFAPFTVKTERDAPVLRDAEHATSARDAALLAIHGLASADRRLSDDWLAASLSTDEARALLNVAASLARQPLSPQADVDLSRLPGFASALARAVDGESRGDVLLNRQDVQYLLSFRDAEEIEKPYRADVALLLREGVISLYPDATLRPGQLLTRARALALAARLLEARALFKLTRATARPSAQSSLVLRPAKGSDRALTLVEKAFVFRAHGAQLFPVEEVSLVGGEPVAYHTDARGQIDYLEVRHAPNGAAADRFAPRANWTVTLTPTEVARRLGARAKQAGEVTDLRVLARGVSRRVTDLEVIGATGTAHVRGGRVRSALGLHEQLFVIERRFDETGRVEQFTFRGRGWGHGVGMCQVGAYGMARAGLSHEKILKAYYSGVDLKKLY